MIDRPGYAAQPAAKSRRRYSITSTWSPYARGVRVALLPAVAFLGDREVGAHLLAPAGDLGRVLLRDREAVGVGGIGVQAHLGDGVVLADAARGSG